jgi:hypothetical protein
VAELTLDDVERHASRALGASELRFFSVVSTIGTPLDVTAQELRVEAFFPSDAVTQQEWTAG